MKRAKLYRTNVFEGAIAMVHSMPMTIWEIFIPRSNIIVNDAGGCFEDEGPRSPINNEVVDIEVDEAFVKACEKRIESTKEFDEAIGLFDRLKEEHESTLKDNITI